MHILLGTFGALSAALALSLCLVLRKVAFTNGDLPVTAEWIDELSLDRYRPMLRLLEAQDLEFLRAQPGFTSNMETQLRRQRCQMFQGYLRSLSMDFRRMCAAIRLMMLCSDNDRPDLAAALLHQQFVFGMAFVQVECSLLLYRFRLGEVNVAGLMRTFDSTRVELRRLMPSVALVA